MGKVAEAAAARLNAERAETLRLLGGLSDAECRTAVEWYGRRQSVGHLLRAFTTHTLDHYQHLIRLLQARGRKLTEAQLLLMKAHAAQAEFSALVGSLSDEAFEEAGPNDDDWSAGQVLEHVLDNERRYREAILAALGNGVATS